LDFPVCRFSLLGLPAHGFTFTRLVAHARCLRSRSGLLRLPRAHGLRTHAVPAAYLPRYSLRPAYHLRTRSSHVAVAVGSHIGYAFWFHYRTWVWFTVTVHTYRCSSTDTVGLPVCGCCVLPHHPAGSILLGSTHGYYGSFTCVLRLQFGLYGYRAHAFWFVYCLRFRHHTAYTSFILVRTRITALPCIHVLLDYTPPRLRLRARFCRLRIGFIPHRTFFARLRLPARFRVCRLGYIFGLYYVGSYIRVTTFGLRLCTGLRAHVRYGFCYLLHTYVSFTVVLHYVARTAFAFIYAVTLPFAFYGCAVALPLHAFAWILPPTTCTAHTVRTTSHVLVGSHFGLPPAARCTRAPVGYTFSGLPVHAVYAFYARLLGSFGLLLRCAVIVHATRIRMVTAVYAVLVAFCARACVLRFSRVRAVHLRLRTTRSVTLLRYHLGYTRLLVCSVHLHGSVACVLHYSSPFWVCVTARVCCLFGSRVARFRVRATQPPALRVCTRTHTTGYVRLPRFFRLGSYLPVTAYLGSALHCLPRHHHGYYLVLPRYLHFTFLHYSSDLSPRCPRCVAVWIPVLSVHGSHWFTVRSHIFVAFCHFWFGSRLVHVLPVVSFTFTHTVVRHHGLPVLRFTTKLHGSRFAWFRRLVLRSTRLPCILLPRNLRFQLDYCHCSLHAFQFCHAALALFCLHTTPLPHACTAPRTPRAHLTRFLPLPILHLFPVLPVLGSAARLRSPRGSGLRSFRLHHHTGSFYLRTPLPFYITGSRVLHCTHHTVAAHHTFPHHGLHAPLLPFRFTHCVPRLWRSLHAGVPGLSAVHVTARSLHRCLPVTVGWDLYGSFIGLRTPVGTTPHAPRLRWLRLRWLRTRVRGLFIRPPTYGYLTAPRFGLHAAFRRFVRLVLPHWFAHTGSCTAYAHTLLGFLVTRFWLH